MCSSESHVSFSMFPFICFFNALWDFIFHIISFHIVCSFTVYILIVAVILRVVGLLLCLLLVCCLKKGRSARRQSSTSLNITSSDEDILPLVPVQPAPPAQPTPAPPAQPAPPAVSASSSSEESLSEPIARRTRSRTTLETSL